MTQELKLYFCPKCRSHDVKAMFSWRNVFGIFPRWKCRKCGYESMMFPLAVYKKNKLNKSRRN